MSHTPETPLSSLSTGLEPIPTHTTEGLSLFSGDESKMQPDRQLNAVADWIRAEVHRQGKTLAGVFGASIRRALDEVIDGPRTGRWDVSQLEKTEKTYIGTKI